MDDTEMDAKVLRLIQGLAIQPDGLGSKLREPTIYDNAWVSMLSRPNADGTINWVFPESFQFVLDSQQQDGGWTANDSKTDTILNTLAATLALKKHRRYLRQDEKSREASFDLLCSKKRLRFSTLSF